MSKIKTLLVLIPFLAGMLFNPIQITAGSPNFIAAPASESNCNLPAPTGLQVVDVTATSIEVAWNAVPGAVEYYVEARNTSNNTLYYSNTTANLSEVCSGLPPNTEITISVQASCGQGNVSENRGVINTFTEFVIEVVGNGYMPCNSLEFMTNSSFDGVDFDQFEGHLLNAEEEMICRFNIRVFTDEVVFSDLGGEPGKLRETTPSSNIIFICENIQSTPDDFCEITVGQSQFSSTVHFEVNILDQNYHLNTYKCVGNDGGGGGKGSEPRNNEIASFDKNSSIQIFPNPVTESLSFSIESFQVNTPSTISIYDINGNIIKSQTKYNINPGEVYSISTEDISGGLYLISITTQNTHFIKQFHKI